MTSRERFFSCLERKGYDRIPVKHEFGTPEFHEKLFKATGWNRDTLREHVGHDFEGVGPKYCGPELKKFPDGSSEGMWGEIWAPQPYGAGENAGVYYEPILNDKRCLPFAGIEDVEQLKGRRWPSADWFDYSDIREQCQKIRAKGNVVLYAPFSFDFINNTARTRGMEQVLLDIGLRHPVFMELMRRRYEFHIEKDRRVFEAAKGLIDVYEACEDLGSQTGLIISPKTFDELFADYYKEVFTLAHKHGARTMMHICGGARALIPRLIEIGLDIYDVTQVSAEGMAIEGLQRDFGDKLNFAGSMCIQTILVKGTPEIVRNEVEKRLELFRDGGLILGPSHAIQVNTPVENVLAMYRAAGSLKE